MSSVDTSPRDVKAIVARYKTIGLCGGIFFGAIVGVMIAGPNFREWSWLRTLVTIVGSTTVAGVVGYFAGELAIGGAGAGPGHALSSEGENHSHIPSADAGGGASDGGHSSGDT